MPELPTRWVSFEVSEGTFMNVDVSPDGDTLIFDLLGDLYRLPIEGGDATSLTAGMAWDQAPRFSPDGKHVYFVSDRVGYKNLWRLTLADQSLQQVTDLDRDIVGSPNWSQRTGNLIVGVEESSHEGLALALTDKVLNYVDPNSKELTPINSPGSSPGSTSTRERLRDLVVTYSGVESSDGEIFFSAPSGLEGLHKRYDRLYSFDFATQTRDLVTSKDASYSEYKPQISHNGEWLAYYRQYDDRRTELRLLNRKTGQDSSLVELADADDAYYYDEDSRPNYAFTPDNSSVVFWHDGKIRRVSIVDKTVETIRFNVEVEREVVERVEPDVQHIDDSSSAVNSIRWPSSSSDARVMAFVAIGYVWVMDMQSGEIRRVSSSNDFEYMATISPDGESIAYTSFSEAEGGYSAGRLMVTNIRSNETTMVLEDTGASYLLPRWSRDGSKIAVIRQQGRLGRGGLEFGWTSVAKGHFNEVASVSAEARPLFMNHILFVGFDRTGSKLLFSYPESKVRTILAMADIDGGSQEVIAAGAPEVAGIVPSPDLTHLALTLRDDSIWGIPFSAEGIPNTVSPGSPGAYQVSNSGGYYPYWSDTRQLTFSSGNRVYKHDSKDLGLQFLDIKLSPSLPSQDKVIAFKGARLITISGDSGAGPVIENGTLVTHRNRIVAIGATDEVEIPTDAITIDVHGKTIVPGFLDTHYHRLGGYTAFGLPRSPNFDDESAIRFGITSAWDPASVVDVAQAGADLQRTGRTAGPRWAFTGPVVNYPSDLYLSIDFLEDYSQAFAAVEFRTDLGAVVLKDSSTRTRERRRWFVAAAYEKGVGIVAHLEDFDGTMTRVVDGYTGGDHPSLPAPFFDDVQELLVRSDFIWTPNVTITWSSKGGWEDMELYYCNAVFQANNDSYRQKLGEYFSVCEGGDRVPSVNYDTHRISRVAEQVAKSSQAGVTIGVSAHNMPGLLLHREMWYLWKGGMPIEDILRATTVNNAEKLGLQEEIGSLEVGKVADFLVFRENPLEDIVNTLSIEYTVQGGVVYDSSTSERTDLVN